MKTEANDRNREGKKQAKQTEGRTDESKTCGGNEPLFVEKENIKHRSTSTYLIALGDCL